jgi:transposase
VIALPTDAEQRQRLLEISRSRTEPASRVERARIILAYLQNPSAYAVARAIEVTQQTVTRCLERAAELGVIAALDDRPRAGRDPVITAEAKTWLVALACRKAKELGYPHELWTTRLLAAHARQHGPSAGHPSLGKLAQGTVCKILAEQEVKPHKVRYYLEQRDPEFEPKMAEILCVYRQVAVLRAEGEKSGGQDGGSLALVSYDEKPGIQAIGTTAPDRPPLPGTSSTVMRDHEYKRHGTLTLMAGIDLLTGHVHALVKERHRSREFIEFLKLLDAAYPADTACRSTAPSCTGVALPGVSALCLPGSGRVRVRAGVLDRLWPARRTGVFRPVMGLGLGRLGASRHRRRSGPFRARFRRPRLVLGQCMGA